MLFSISFYCVFQKIFHSFFFSLSWNPSFFFNAFKDDALEFISFIYDKYYRTKDIIYVWFLILFNAWSWLSHVIDTTKSRTLIVFALIVLSVRRILEFNIVEGNSKNRFKPPSKWNSFRNKISEFHFLKHLNTPFRINCCENFLSDLFGVILTYDVSQQDIL